MSDHAVEAVVATAIDSDPTQASRTSRLIDLDSAARYQELWLYGQFQERLNSTPEFQYLPP